MHKRIAAVVLIVSTFILTGCWDKIEIERRAFIQVIAIDKVPKGAGTDDNDRYLVTYVFPITAMLKAEGGESGGKGTANATISVTGETLSQCNYLMSTRLERTLYFNQTKIMLFGKELVEDRQLMRETKDKLARDHRLNRRMYVGVVDGMAKDVLVIKPRVARLIVGYLSELFENKLRSIRVRSMEAREFLTSMREDGNLIMPKLVPYEQEAKVAGGAIIKDHRFLAWLGEKDSAFSSFLEGKVKAGVISVMYKGAPVSYNVFHAKRKIKYDGIQGGRLSFIISLDIEGDLEEFRLGQELFDSKVIAQVENLVNKEMERRSKEVLDKYQHLYKMDGLNLHDFLKKYHPEVWAKVKDDWEQVFSDALITVKTDAKVRRVGMIK